MRPNWDKSPSSLRRGIVNPTCHHTPEELTIIAEQMPVDAVNFSLWVKAGSAVETDATNGMAHFLEHIFKGTQRLLEGEFERQVEARGGVTNAVTSQDYTCFYVTVAPDDFAAIAPLQIDLALNASLDADSFERERLVISRSNGFWGLIELSFYEEHYSIACSLCSVSLLAALSK